MEFVTSRCRYGPYAEPPPSGPPPPPEVSSLGEDGIQDGLGSAAGDGLGAGFLFGADLLGADLRAGDFFFAALLAAGRFFFETGAAFFALLAFFAFDFAFFAFFAIIASRSVAAQISPSLDTSTLTSPRRSSCRGGNSFPASASGALPPVAQSISSTVWTTGIAVPAAICVIQPRFPAATTSGLSFSIFATLRSRNLPASSGCRILYVPAEPQHK